MRLKILLVLSLLSASVPTALGQAPPAPASPTNAPPARGVTTNVPTVTNAPAINTNQLEAIRRQLQQAISNRVPRTATNRAAFPLPPGITATNVAVATNAQPSPLPLPGALAAPAAQVAPPPGAAPPTVGTQPSGPGQANAASGVERAEHILKFNNAPPDQIFEKYSELTGRTVLRPAALPAAAVTIITYSPLTREEAIQAIDGALALNNITMIPQGEKFVKAVPSTQSLQEGAAISPKKSDELPDAEQFVTHVVQLKVVKPSEVAQLFTSFTKNPAGIVPIDSSQILVIRDYASNVKRMLELIEKVDVTPESDYLLEVIPIKYGKVTDLFSTMNALISGSTGGGAFGTTTPSMQQRRGGQFATLGGGTSGRYGTQSNRYGQQPGSQVQPLAAGQQPGTAPAASFQQRLNQIVNRAAGESQIQVLGDARIVPDERSNSLIVYANKQDIKMITNIVSKFYVLLTQVLIEGIVLAVNLTDSEDLGISWLQKQKQFSQDITGAGGINNGPGFLTNATSLASSLPSGFSYFAKLGNSYEVALQALAKDGRVRVLQRPRVQTSHAVPGFFFTGQTVPFVSGFYDYGFGTGISTRGSIERQEVGVNLSVTPYITPDGLVVLDVTQDISSLDGLIEVSAGQKAPQTSTRYAQATLSVRDGETIMLGGYVEDSRSNNKSGVPILKDIPLLGNLFRSKSRDNRRTELILLMKVTVLKDPAMASSQAETEKAKLPGVSEADREFKRTEEKKRPD